MTLPVRRARRRRRLGIRSPYGQIGPIDLFGKDGLGTKLAPEIELGWNNLLDELIDAGWPACAPEGDQKPGHIHVCNVDCDDPCDAINQGLSYADPTGWMVNGLASMHGDLEALQDHLAVVAHSLRALQLIANRHRPTLSPAIPGCIVGTCDEPVESRTLPDGRRAYLGMEQIAGHWVAKPGCTPTCKRHRSRRERDSAA